MKKTKNSPRKSPTQSRSDQLVQSILTAATRILEKSGFDKSTTNHIAELAGVSIGSFYQYFPNKGALVAALIDLQIEKNLSEISKKIQTAQLKSLPDAIVFLVDEMVQILMQEKGFFRKLFVEALRLNRVESLVKARRSGAEMFESVLRMHVENLKSPDTKTLAFICTNSVMGVLQIAALSETLDFDQATLKSELVSLLMGYLIPAKPISKS